jgi:hypothetical protein
MYLRDLGATLRHRWYLTIIGLLATAGLCIATLSLFPATYRAQANIVLLPPASTVGAGGNPYLQLGNLTQVVDVMIRALNSQTAVEQIAIVAPTGTYEVAADYTTNGPIFIITAEDKTPEASIATLKAVSDKVAPTLVGLQKALDIAPSSQITSSVLTSDEHPETVRKAQLRALIVAMSVGLLASAILVALIDSLLRRRSSRRAVATAVIEPTKSAAQVDKVHAPEDTGARGRTRRLGLSNPAPADRKVLLGSGQSPTPGTNGDNGRRR